MAIDLGIKILLVEDSGFVRRSAIKNLKGLGFENVMEAEDGNAAIALLEAAEQVDVIVSDWVMPNKDGLELLMWARASEKYKTTPFIMATARSEKKQVTKATDAGVTDFITKPFSGNELIALIEKVLSGESKSASSAAKVLQPQVSPLGKLRIKVAHIQITDHLTLGVLKNLIDTQQLKPQHFELETVCMPSWNPVQQDLEQGEVDAAFVLAPIAMDMYGYGVPIKLVLLAHKNGSIFVRKRNPDSSQSLVDFFRNKTFYIPHELSIHHMISHMFLRGLGLNPGFQGRGDYDAFFEVVPPVLMPEYLANNPDAGGFLVAEPMGTKAVAQGIAELMFLSGDLWENHPCCVVAMRNELVSGYPEAVQEFVSMLVQAGQFIEQKPETAAAIGVSFLDPTKQLGLKESVLRDVLKEDHGIKTDDMFPVKEDLDHMQRYMANELGVGSLINLDQFVDTTFAEPACKNITSAKSVMHDVSEIVSSVGRQQNGKNRRVKASLNLEGKYLTFTVGDGEYGLGITGVREITEMKPITVVPNSRECVKGVINLRSEIIPVIDLSHKLGMGNGRYNQRARIIIVGVNSEKGTNQLGIMVDSVSDVLEIQAQDIEDNNPLTKGKQAEYIVGYAKNNGKIRILLDTTKLFATL